MTQDTFTCEQILLWLRSYNSHLGTTPRLALMAGRDEEVIQAMQAFRDNTPA